MEENLTGNDSDNLTLNLVVVSGTNRTINDFDYSSLSVIGGSSSSSKVMGAKTSSFGLVFYLIIVFIIFAFILLVRAMSTKANIYSHKIR